MNLKHLLANTLVALYRARHIAIAIATSLIPNSLLALTVLPDIGGEQLRCSYAHDSTTCAAADVDPNCYTPNSLDGSCDKCLSTINTNGVKVTYNATWGLANSATCTCSCFNSYVKSYECAVGYYGTAVTGQSGNYAGCTVCPANATCAGGNNSTFVCNTGYYLSGSGKCYVCPTGKICFGGNIQPICDTGFYDIGSGNCKACVANATCDGGDSQPKCNKGLYPNMVSGIVTGCNQCPEYSGYYSPSEPGPSGATGYYVAYGTTAAAGASSVSACFIPQNALAIDKSGIIQYPNNTLCYYK